MSDKITKKVYASYDGDPAVIAHYSDGRIYAFVKDGEWKPSNAAEVSINSAVMDEADFKKRWPAAGLPAFPE